MRAVVLCIMAVHLGTAQAPFAKVSAEATAAREANDTGKAVELYRQAVKLKPDWKEGWWYLGTLLYEADLYPDARDAFRQFNLLEKNSAPGLVMVGLCEFQTREYERALMHLERGRELGVGANRELDNVSRYHLALLLTRDQQYERANELLAAFARLGNDRTTIVEAEGIAALRMPMLPAEVPPDRRDIVMMAGRAVHEGNARREASARKAFEEVIARYPDAPNLHYLFGSFLLLNSPEQAIAELKLELQRSPKHVPARIVLALEYLKRGDSASALPFAREAVELDAKSFIGHNAYGRALVEQGQLDNGIKELELAAKIAPDSPETRYALAGAYAKAGRKADAARERAAFLKLNETRGR
jgi:tetratricopeptide (TPR) repeat protein